MRPFFDLCLTFLLQNSFFVRTFLCSLTVHIFLFLFALVSKITGIRPEKCSKSRIFYIEAPTKGFVTFLWHWQQTKNSNLMQIWAYICGCKTRIYAYKVLRWLVMDVDGLQWTWSKLRKGGWKGGISLLPRLQGVPRICPRCPPIIETKGLWPFWGHIQRAQSVDIQRVAAKITMWVIHK